MKKVLTARYPCPRQASGAAKLVHILNVRSHFNPKECLLFTAPLLYKNDDRHGKYCLIPGVDFFKKGLPIYGTQAGILP
jgi:hypothetical protein